MQESPQQEIQGLGRLQVSDGIEVAFTCVGPRQDPRVDARVALPLMVPAMSWLAKDLEQLSSDRSVVFFDVRGRGRSSRVDSIERLSLDLDVDDLESLRAHLAASDPCFERIALLGWSYYGALAARFALAHPTRVDRLILVGPTPPRSKPWFGRFLDNFAQRVDLTALHQLEQDKRAGLRERDPKAYGRRVNDVFHRAYVVDPEVITTMKSDPCVDPNADVDRVNDQSRRVLEKLGDYDWRGDFSALKAPVLILHGSEDPIPSAGSEEWFASLPNAQFSLFEGVGHMPWLEAPERFHAALSDFLRAETPRP